MIKVDFATFWKLVDNEPINKINIHCMERAEWFGFHIKSHTLNEYYTTVLLEEVLSFGRSEQAVMDFYNTYISRCIQVESIDGIESPISIPIIVLDDESEEEINKTPDVDVVEEADDYADFYIKNVKKWEKQVISRFEKISMKSYTPATIKTFGEFVQATVNTINTIPFTRTIRKYVKQGLKEGIDAAELEVGVDVGFTGAFDDILLALQNQQLNGYTIHGKMWYGIKGASKELHVRILRQVQEDVQNRVPKQEMLQNIRRIFDGVATSQAERIARTETTRFVNEGKLTTYKESGVEGRKAWSAVLDNHTSELCDRLHDKYFENGIPYDEDFVDDTTGLRFKYPPAHPNCRSVIEFRLNE